MPSATAAPELQTSRLSDDAVLMLIPPLLHFYLHCGCMVCGEPYYDNEFKTYDFFTLLDFKTASPAMQKFLTRARLTAVEQKAGGM
jgi:putative hemolysin